MIQNLVNKAKEIHFIGIGGIGMSALAKLLDESGKIISGSDQIENKQTKHLKSEGLKIQMGHDQNIIQTQDLIVKSFAIPDTNPEIKAAIEKKIPILTYPEALSQFAENYKLIAIAGTHGKTTTTGMLTKVLIDAGLDPTILIGSTTPHLGNTNYRKGNSEWMLIEACEYNSGFLSFHPYITLITNLEHDHFDAYPTEDSYLRAFQQLIQQTQFKTIINRDLALSFQLEGLQNNQDYQSGDEKIQLIALGEHNNTNAIGALHVAEALGINPTQAKQSLYGFQGTSRRMEVKKHNPNQIFIDDYGHHPSEIKVVLEALKQEFPNKKIALVFQAHQHGRTIALLDEFTHSFKLADKVIIPNIYTARDSQKDIQEMSGQHFADEIAKHHPNVVFSDGLENTKANLANLTKGYEIVLAMGAGDVYKVFDK